MTRVWVWVLKFFILFLFLEGKKLKISLTTLEEYNSKKKKLGMEKTKEQLLSPTDLSSDFVLLLYRMWGTPCPKLACSAPMCIVAAAASQHRLRTQIGCWDGLCSPHGARWMNSF